MARTGSGTGQGGKTYEERELAKSVRNLALNEIQKILKNPRHKFYGPVIVKLAGSVLPRLNEHTGEDGGAINVAITGMKILKDGDRISNEK